MRFLSQLVTSVSIEPGLVRIPEGWFLMGSDAGQDCERPIHKVWIDAFLLSATQVTNSEYDRFVNATASPAAPFRHDPNFNHPRQPVVAVSWFEASQYCRWLSEQEKIASGERSRTKRVEISGVSVLQVQALMAPTP